MYLQDILITKPELVVQLTTTNLMMHGDELQITIQDLQHIRYVRGVDVVDTVGIILIGERNVQHLSDPIIHVEIKLILGKSAVEKQKIPLNRQLSISIKQIYSTLIY